eukprot:GHRR01023750.1.p1 GENE.GHRR01023750.1~~GHRR01023750.1.p1  ORF type:complete len:137 (-),score=14.75 GHRR01023750.1:77-487(-)
MQCSTYGTKTQTCMLGLCTELLARRRRRKALLVCSSEAASTAATGSMTSQLWHIPIVPSKQGAQPCHGGKAPHEGHLTTMYTPFAVTLTWVEVRVAAPGVSSVVAQDGLGCREAMDNEVTGVSRSQGKRYAYRKGR